MTIIDPPLSVRRRLVRSVSELYRAALDECEWIDVDRLASDGVRVRIETYPIDTVCHLVEDVWQWQCAIADLDEGDKLRVKRIMEAIKKDGAWPYVSYWARDMEELTETTVEDTGEISVPNHGDGWHRIIANVELNRLTMEVLFLES